MSSDTPDPALDHAGNRLDIVGLGASAGGLEALDQFFGSVKPDGATCFLVVQHLDPTRKAMLVELLQRVTAMPVVEASDGMVLRADTVFVVPPDGELTLVGDRLRVRKPTEARGQRLPIDALFRSLAAQAGDRAVGVVLSGMGADGTLGLQAIRARHGLTLAQQPESAQFDSMPRSAIAAGCVDIIAQAGALPGYLRRGPGQRLQAEAAPPADGKQADAYDALDGVLALLHAHSGHDLSQYKRSTLWRRVERRMGVHRIRELSRYEELLRANGQELELLFKEVLIGVTSFFRDPPAWAEMRDVVLPEFFGRSPPGTAFRAWVSGCSTGEEAYSLAMVFAEAIAAEQPPASHTLQIFASDLSADAIAAARRGHYPEQIAADVGLQRLQRFFRPEPGGYGIAKEIRDTVLFAQHDVLLDAPFTRLDILSCRNLFIYLSPALQARLLPLFHYCLREGGVLMLGASETVGSARTLFELRASGSKVYRRRDLARNALAVRFPASRRAGAPLNKETALSSPSHPGSGLPAYADRLVLAEFAPPAVLVNQVGDILYISGRTGRFLEPAAGKANWNIHVMLHPDIRVPVTAAVREALEQDRRIELTGLGLAAETPLALDVTVMPVRNPEEMASLVLIVFRALPAAAAVAGRRARRGAPAATDAAEIARLQAQIRALHAEMVSSREELQAAIEELQSTNEELQSANEELTTSKEESQSMNEELQTINHELQSKLDELALAQSDMKNLLNSTDIATLFLDDKLNVRRYTARMQQIVHLRDGDIGRPLSDLSTTLEYTDLEADAHHTLRTLAVAERQVASKDGHWYAVRIMPYRTLANVIQGIVLTFVDISKMKELEARLRTSQDPRPAAG